MTKRKRVRKIKAWAIVNDAAIWEGYDENERCVFGLQLFAKRKFAEDKMGKYITPELWRVERVEIVFKEPRR